MCVYIRIYAFIVNCLDIYGVQVVTMHNSVVCDERL